MKNVAIFFGGVSVEHDISVITGVLTLNSVDKTLYNPIPVYVDNNGEWFTGNILFDIDGYKNLNVKKLKRVTLINGDNSLYFVKGKRLKKYLSVYCAVNCLHGENGEDGCLFGLLKTCNIPVTSSGLASASISMDKSLTKILLKGIGVKRLNCITLYDGESIKDKINDVEYPVIIKPAYLGSSIGITKANGYNELIDGIRLAFKYGDKLIIEKYLNDFTEINCAVYTEEDGELKVSECEKPVNDGDILTFSEKYLCGKREFPAKIEKRLSNKIKEVSKKVYSKLGFSGIIRIDYIIYENEVYLNEINSVPGSLSYYLFCDTLKEYKDLLTKLINKTCFDFAKKSGYIKKYSSEVLNLSGAKSSKRL